MFRQIVVLLILSVTPFSALGSHQVIRFVPSDELFDPSHQYYIELLKLVLNKTKKPDDTYELRPADFHMVQSRAITELEKGEKIDIFWTMTSVKRESNLLPVRIPLLKGLLGYRVFLIRSEDQKAFTKVNKLADLRKFVAGQGHDWPDTFILRHSKIPVTGVPNFDALFTMLYKKHIDYIPRGVHELWSEIDSYPDKKFSIDSQVLLKYKAPVYFFVNKNNEQLAQRIQQGLTIAIEDGSFEQLFSRYYAVEKLANKLKINQRLVLQLVNPYLPIQTPLNKSEYWIEL